MNRWRIFYRIAMCNKTSQHFGMKFHLIPLVRSCPESSFSPLRTWKTPTKHCINYERWMEGHHQRWIAISTIKLFYACLLAFLVSFRSAWQKFWKTERFRKWNDRRTPRYADNALPRSIFFAVEKLHRCYFQCMPRRVWPFFVTFYPTSLENSCKPVDRL